MEEISITRALAELKLLDNKINSKIDESSFVHFISKKNKSVNQDILNRISQGSFQSINDLITRRRKIKSAIILSNASTIVKLNGKEMSVAEVIETKQEIIFYINLLNKLKRNREQVFNQVERHNQQMEMELQKLLEINFGKQTSMKTNSDDIENISKTFRENNKADMLDPINIDTKIVEVEETLRVYQTEVNFVLSESNALTKIKI